MLGVKIIKIKTKEKMDLEALYNRIKDIPFEAGTPQYIKHGLNWVIAFPPENQENQVWIIKTKKGFTIQRSTIIAGVKNMAKNMAKAEVLDNLTFGVSGVKSHFGSPKKACIAHCDDVAAKIDALDL